MAARLVGATSIYAGLAFAQRATGFLLLPLYVRWLTPEEYGRVGVLLAISTLAAYIFPMGLEPIATRAWLKRDTSMKGLPPEMQDLQGVATGAPVVLALPLIATMSLVGVAEVAGYLPSLLAVLSAAMLSAATVIPYAILRADRRVGPYGLVAALYLATQTGLKVTMVGVFSLGVLGWVLADLAAGGLLIIVGPRVVGLRLSVPRLSPTARRFAASGLHLLPHSIALWGLALFDRVYLTRWVPLADVATYTLAQQVGAVVLILIAEFNRYLAPDYVSRAGSIRLAELTGRHAGAVLIFGTSAIIVVYQAVLVLLPSTYHDAARLTPWFIGGAMVVGLYHIPMNHLTLTHGVTRRLWAASAAAVSANVIMNVLAVPVWGLKGAAVSSLASYVLLWLIVWLWFDRRLESGPAPISWPSAITGLLISVLLAICGIAITSKLSPPLALILCSLTGLVALTSFFLAVFGPSFGKASVEA